MQTTTSSTISWTESFLKTLLWINWNFLIPTGKSSFAKIINHMNKHQWWHYTDVIMGAIASPITSLTIVYSTVYSDADQREHQSSASLAFVRGIHRGRHHGIHKRLWATTSKHLTFNDKCINVKIKGISQNWLNCLHYRLHLRVHRKKNSENLNTMRNMMTSSNGNISALLAFCAGISSVTGEFHAQRPVTRSSDVFFDLRLN